MEMLIRSRCFGFVLAVVLSLSATQLIHAAPPSVTAVLSSSDAEIGQAVDLQIKVSGARSANVPAEIPVDGLQIRQTGTSQQIEMHNFDVSSSVIYNYTIMPLRSGKFKIPAQAIRVGNDSLHTPELTLNVTSGSSGS